MGGGTISQIAGWVAWPYKNTIPLGTLVLATIVIVVLVWIVADGAQWPSFEDVTPPLAA